LYQSNKVLALEWQSRLPLIIYLRVVNSNRRKMGMRLAVLSLVVLLFLSLSAFAQNGTVFGGYSYMNIDTNGATSRQSFNGWEGGTSYNLYKQFAIEGSVSGYYNGNIDNTGVSGNNYLYLVGPRVNLGNVLFAHVLLGGDHLSASALGSSASDNSFAMAIGGGAQIKIAPHWAVRPSFDYVPTFFSSSTQHNIRVGGGIAYLFGQTGSSK
jgi:opacity protein-like surface antigen